MSQRHQVEVHAYVLMDNHYHLLVRTPHANLSPAMQWLNVAYSLWWKPGPGSCSAAFIFTSIRWP